jgi:methoxymalonate biosynthesis acyl carrier protein
MATSDNADPILAFIIRHIRKDDIKPDEDIFAAGYVNSLFALQLITFVEKTFSIHVDDEDLDLENFRTVTAIGQFVQRKRTRGQP